MNEQTHIRNMLNKPGQYDTGTKKWYLIRCWKGQEERTFIKLKANRFEGYYPQITADKRLTNKELEPLFECYIFLLMRIGLEGDNWQELNRIIHPAHVIKSRATRTPEVVPDGLILALKANETDGVIQSYREYSEGDEIRVKSGAFANYVSEIQKLPLGERVAFLLNDIMVEMDLSEVEPVE